MKHRWKFISTLKSPNIKMHELLGESTMYCSLGLEIGPYAPAQLTHIIHSISLDP